MLDGALYFGQPDWPGARADYLFNEVLFPSAARPCSANVRASGAEEIARHRLLHLVTRPEAWRRWCHEADVADVNVMRGPRFDIQSMLISAACSGLGVALMPRFLIADQLRSGELKILSNLSVLSEGSITSPIPRKRRRIRSWPCSGPGCGARPETFHRAMTQPGAGRAAK